MTNLRVGHFLLFERSGNVLPKINSAHGSDTRNIINRAIDVLNQQGKTIQDLVADGQLTPGQYAELIKIVNGNISEGENEKITWGMLDQFVKEQFTGGNTPVVGANSVNTTNIVDNSVTSSKRTELGSIALYNAASYTSHPDISLSSKTVTFYSTFYITYGNRRFEIVDDVILNFDGLGTIVYIVFDLSSRTFRAVAGANFSAVNEREALVMTLNFSHHNQIRLTNVFFTGDYTVNGESSMIDTDNITRKSVTFDKKTELGGIALYNTASYTSHPDISLSSKTVTFYSTFYITYGNRRFQITGDVTLDFDGLGTIVYIVYNVTNNTLSAVAGSDFSEMNEREVLVMTLNFSHLDQVRLTNVFFTGDYTVDGRTPGEISKMNDLLNQSFISPDVSIEGIFNTDTQFDDYSNFNRATSNEVYAMYDELVDAYPDYITKEFLGDDETGLPISAYHFAPQKPDSTSQRRRFPKAFIVCGMHGYEHLPPLTMYLMIKEMCERWHEDHLLEALRFNVEFIIIPVANPYGWNEYQRKNYNGVDLIRNFPTRHWAENDPDSATYMGPEPLSELSAQYVHQIIEDHPDIDMLYDFHNFAHLEPEDRFLWIATTSGASAPGINVQPMAQNLISSMTRKWGKDFDFTDPEVFNGFTNTIAEGNLSYYAAAERGIVLSAIFETRLIWKSDPNGQEYDQNVCKASVEAITNWMLMNYRELLRTKG